MTTHTFHPSILREYDIRGIVGKTLTPRDAWAVGASIGTMVVARGGRKVALGQDGRLSSPEMADAVAEGLISTGVDTTRIGVGPTPMLYFADRILGTDAGIRSHRFAFFTR